MTGSVSHGGVGCVVGAGRVVGGVVGCCVLVGRSVGAGRVVVGVLGCGVVVGHVVEVIDPILEDVVERVERVESGERVDGVGGRVEVGKVRLLERHRAESGGDAGHGVALFDRGRVGEVAETGSDQVAGQVGHSSLGEEGLGSLTEGRLVGRVLQQPLDGSTNAHGTIMAHVGSAPIGDVPGSR